MRSLQVGSDFLCAVSLKFCLNTKLDPDAPSRANPSSREFLHWLVTNIPGCDIAKGDQFAEYIGSDAPKDTGKTDKYVDTKYIISNAMLFCLWSVKFEMKRDSTTNLSPRKQSKRTHSKVAMFQIFTDIVSSYSNSQGKSRLM